MPPMTNFTRSCLALAVGHALASTSASAATVTVDTNLDTGTTTECTLRSAITLINHQTDNTYLGCTADISINVLGVDDEVEFNLPLGEEIISLNGNALLIIEPMSINPAFEPGVSTPITIDAANQSRVITIAGGSSDTTINGLTIKGGSYNGDGGGVYMSNANDVTISNSTITENTSTGVGGGVFVRDAVGFSISSSSLTQNTGAIYLRSTNDATISDSTISNNQSDNNGVGINLYSANRTLIEQNVISDNSTNGAGDTGGAMYILYGESNALVNSTVSNNYAGDGGGIYLQSTNNMSIVGSTINANSVASRGGGVFAYNSNNLNIVNSTISANSAPTADGGGIYWDDNSAFGSIVQSSIVDNLANEGGGIYALRSIDLSNNVFASNVSNASSNNDCNGSVVGTDVGNWVSDGSCNGSAASGDPKLGSLEDNGGLTLTHAPKAGSGLNKAGDIAVCTNLLVNGVDQRGEARGETECTIGAVEYIDDGSFFVVPLPGGKAVIFGI